MTSERKCYFVSATRKDSRLPAANALQALWLAYFSQPATDRVLYRAVRKARPRRIVEIGLGDGRRAQRLISLAQRYHPPADIRYTGVDLFESRGADGSLQLKQAYRTLRATKSRINLIPGETGAAVSRIANVLRSNDLVLISSDEELPALSRLWFYLPRMLASHALIFFGPATPREGAAWRALSAAELESLAIDATRRRAA